MIHGKRTKTAKLAEQLKDKVREERLPKDSPFMSVRKLAEYFCISTKTAARILDLLIEEGILYHKPKVGTFIKNNPPVIPSIAYAGPLPDPENTNPLSYDATSRLMKHFAELGIQPVLISYYELRHPETVRQKLRKTTGLLVHASFIDEVTQTALWNYSGTGRIAVVGKTFLEDRFPCSQVFPDFTEPLLEFNHFKAFDSYDRILIVQANHLNASAASETVRRVLKILSVPQTKIEEVRLITSGPIDAYIKANCYFSRRDDLPDNTLIVSMSEYFSQAIREIFSKGGKMPDILSFDNMESYQKNTESAPFFTSIDWQVGLMVCRALDLLCSQLNDPGAEQTILRIPAKLVIRKSVKTDGSAGIPHPAPEQEMISNPKILNP